MMAPICYAPFLTQPGDADLLQILPGDVLDNSDGVIPIVT